MKCPHVTPTISQCLNCKLKDCDNNNLTTDDFKADKKLDRYINEPGFFREKERKRVAEYDSNHRIEKCENAKRYYSENKDRVKRVKKEWQQSNKEYINAKQREWYRNHREQELKRNKDYKRRLKERQAV
ncbi:MAG: hypothetical protein K0S76_466 [Herbinix sp.]|jgi:hypothetical protein|nr:hypothetical protein [Herbinix sp.]